MMDDRIEQIKRLLERVSGYNRLIISDNFEGSTIDDMKGNAKDICDEAKDKIDEIKDEIDQWSQEVESA